MRTRKGASLLEFTFVAIPLMFILVSIFELSRGMWMYNTLSHAVKESVRYAIVHGNNCAIAPNNCTVTTANICQQLLNAGPGLETTRVHNVTFRSFTRTVSKGSLANCIATGTETFPYTGAPMDPNGQQGNFAEISASYQFDSGLAFFWTGAGRGFTFGRIHLGASSRERIQY